MSTLDLALTAATVLLFLFGIRTLVSKDGPKQLGFGFGLAAALCLSWLYKDELGGYDKGLRLGLGLLLLMPSIKALLQPKGRSIMWAVVTLISAILIAGGPARTAIERTVPGFLPEGQLDLENRLVESENALEKLPELEKFYRMKEAELKGELRNLGGDSAAILASNGGEQKAKQLMHVRQKIAEVQESETMLEKAIQSMRMDLEQLKLAGKGEIGAENPALREALDELEKTGSTPPLGTIEEMMERNDLQEMLDGIKGQ